ncbi:MULTISPECIES: discoidin domain-containing protein [Coprobacillaceae]|uniref:discoidin domain-containing protein n=1 Tax=Coprobacillaceae TaxID=2810280 RepID=UPI000FF38C6C|nr:MULTISPECIES: discoidin domain-containing protein [Coprobacillaceae]RHM59843.1 hypothetical protein DWZ53_08375 [Coprobacillus sp. AF33-1AC]RHS92190.1 hypothetical protein DW911_09140 [Erysipelatoclostridium sp. AM42-17]
MNLKRKLLIGSLTCLMTISNTCIVHAKEPNIGRNLEQRLLEVVEDMPNIPSNYKLIDWEDRGKKLTEFVFDHTATNFDENTEFSVKDNRKFSTIYRDDKYGGYMIPAFYGENRPIVDREIDGKIHDGEDDQESISVTSALISASLLGIDMNKELPEELKGKSTIENGYEINTYLDNELKYYWNKDGVITNVPNGSDSKLQNTNVSNAYGDFWYLLIANQNFFRLSELNPEWRPEEVKEIQRSIADKMVEMIDVLKQRSKETGKGLFDIQCFDFENMKAVEPGWRQPDAATGTASILYYAYKIFNEDKYLTYAKECMDYLQDLESNPYYENMLIDAVYLAAMMNAEVGTNYDISKFWNWITTTSKSSVRNWGSVNYSQDGIDVYGMTGEPNNGYSYFFNSIYPLTSILPAAKYDPSYARMAGKWAINIANASKYFLPSEWSTEHQTDGEFKGQLEESVLAYESLRKNDKGKNFYATGDAKQNATGGWMAGENTTNFGLYGGFYTGFLGALVKETNVEGILKLDCNKTDYYQNNMYQTYLYYNPFMETKEVEIDLGNKYYDIYDSAAGMYLAKNVTGKQTFKMLADSARVIVLTDPNSTVEYQDNTTYINNKLVAHSDAKILEDQGTELITDISIEGPDQITQRGQIAKYNAVLTPSDNIMDPRIIWSITDENGQPTDKAEISKDGVVTVKKNGKIKVIANSIDGSGVKSEKLVTISGQTLASLSQGKPTVTSSVNDNHNGNLAVDGDATTRWNANPSEDHPWIYVDLGTTAKLDLIILSWETARPPKYELQVSSDAQDWRTIATVDDEGNSEKTVRFEFNEEQSEGRYVRIYTNQKSNYGASLYEFDVYGKYNIDVPVGSIEINSENNVGTITTKNKPLQLFATVQPENATDKRVEWFVTDVDGSDTDLAEITSSGKLIPLKNGTVRVTAKAVDGSNKEGCMDIILQNQDKENLALNKKVYVSNSEGSNPGQNAVDGDTNTRWAAGVQDDNQWITVDLGDIYNINKTVLYWENSYLSEYKIQGSMDNVHFQDIYVQNNSKGEVEEIVFDDTPTRYVRIQSIKRGTNYGPSLWEFQLYGTLYEKTYVQDIEIRTETGKNEINTKNKPLQMSAIINPDDATVKTVEWSVYNKDGSETDLATITADGKLIPKENGIVKVVAKATDGSQVEKSIEIKITGQDAQNIALNKNITATSEDGGNQAIDAIDANYISRWASNANNDESITIDLGSLYYVNQVSLAWEDAYGKEYKIEGSLDGNEFFEIQHVTDGDGEIDNIYFDSKLLRYVRMQGIERATQYGYSIYEFEVYGKALKEDLRILYDAVKDTDEALYTPKSFEAFKKALDTAKAVLEKEEVTEQEVKEAYDALTSANEQLQYKADKTYLKTQLDKAHTLKESEYTPNSYAQFKKVLSNAQKVYDNENATQEEVQEVEKTLKDAIEKLVLKANKTELGELIKKAKGLNSKDYTPETFKTLNEALIEAQKTYDNEKATQEDVQKSYVQLKDAYDGLKKVEVNESGNPAIPSNPNDSNKPLKPSDSIQTDSENRNVNGDTVDTSDSSIIIPGIIAIAISGLVILKLKRNKKAFLKNKV